MHAKITWFTVSTVLLYDIHYVSLYKIVVIDPVGSSECKKITETCFAILIYQNHKFYILQAQTQSNKVA